VAEKVARAQAQADAPLPGQQSIGQRLAEIAAEERPGLALLSIASIAVPGVADAIAALAEQEQAELQLQAVAGPAYSEAEHEARRRFAATNMTLTGALRSVYRDLTSGDWSP
jgi:hypothetical protein